VTRRQRHPTSRIRRTLHPVATTVRRGKDATSDVDCTAPQSYSDRARSLPVVPVQNLDSVKGMHRGRRLEVQIVRKRTIDLGKNNRHGSDPAAISWWDRAATTPSSYHLDRSTTDTAASEMGGRHADGVPALPAVPGALCARLRIRAEGRRCPGCPHASMGTPGAAHGGLLQLARAAICCEARSGCRGRAPPASDQLAPGRSALSLRRHDSIVNGSESRSSSSTSSGAAFQFLDRLEWISSGAPARLVREPLTSQKCLIMLPMRMTFAGCSTMSSPNTRGSCPLSPPPEPALPSAMPSGRHRTCCSSATVRSSAYQRILSYDRPELGPWQK